MSDIYEAAREVREAIYVLDNTTERRLGEVVSELGAVRLAFQSMAACLRDISDVLHAAYYGEKTAEEQDDDADGSQAGT